MKTIILTIITILALVMSGCSNSVSEPDMPEIVFKVCTVYNQYEHNFDENDSVEQGRYSLTFVDKNGNYYFSDYSEIYFLSDEELIESLKSGDERITKLPKSCDADELWENYKKLLKVANNKEYGLDYPKFVPSAESDRIIWYGLYYDKDGKLSSLPIHEYKNYTGINANDDRANEIFEWYSVAAKTQ
ncbi:MAG: hypothetical protein K2J77_04245 [Oscillospiraceae bacterium]|nr:hypothetical protein [Oscillospiraceae bacterium]